MFGISSAMLIAAGAGALGALTLEHGWGWVLARIKAYKAQSKTVFEEVTAQVKDATSGLVADVSSLKSDVATIKAKVGL